MSRALPSDQLDEREYWTPGQCALRLGHGAMFWQKAFDAGEVEGYRGQGKRRVRYLLKSSARDFLKRPYRNNGKMNARLRAICAEGRRRRAAERALEASGTLG